MKILLTSFLFIFLTAGLQAQFDCRTTKNQLQAQASPSINNNAKSDTFDIVRYDLALDLTDIKQQNFNARAKVHFSPRMSGVTHLNLDLLELNVDSIKYTAPGNQTTPFTNYTYNDTILALKLNNALNLSDTAHFTIFYSGYPQRDASGWGGFIADKGYFYNLGVGFAANPHTYGRAWFPCYDNFVEKSSYNIEIKSRTPLRPLISGDSISRTMLGGDTLLSSATLKKPTPTYLVSFALADYQFLQDTVVGKNGVKTINLAAKAKDTTKLKNSFQNLKATFHVYEDYFGPYRWPRVGYAATTVGAMEHATSVHFPTNLIDGTLNGEDIMAHELAHHWFGNLVTCQTAGDMWVNEGMAEFCSHLYREKLYGRQDYLKTVRENAYKVLNTAHTRDGGKYRAIAGVPHNYVYGTHVYQKGAMIAHNMRAYLGDSTFFAGLRALLSQNAYGNLSIPAFRDSLIAITGQTQLNDFFQNWLLTKGYPQFSVDSLHYNPSDQKATIEITQRLYEAPSLYSRVPVDVTFFSESGDTTTRTFTHSGKSGTYTTPKLNFQPKFALANYSGKLLTASTYDHFNLNDPITRSGNYGEMTVEINNFQDSGKVIVMHHLAAPEKKANPSFSFELSHRRYWTVRKTGLKDTKLSGTIQFNGSARGWDQQLLASSNDSLKLLYRPSGHARWQLYRHQQKTTAGSTSPIGKIKLTQLQAGDYTLANTGKDISLNEEKTVQKSFQVYPNPTQKQVTVEYPENRQSFDSELKVYKNNGKLIRRQKLRNAQNKIALQDTSTAPFYFVIDGEVHKVLMKK